MEAIALHDFRATADDELSFKKGSLLKVLNIDTNEAEHWRKAEQDGRDGLIPANYIQMKPHEWYHGKISRKDAEDRVLETKQPNGAFLIRESESTPGDFSLTVRFENGVQHFKVLRDGAGKYFLWVVKFNSLNQLVDYHRTSSVSRTQTIYLKDMVTTSGFGNVRALYDFSSQDATELSFKKGDTMTLLQEGKGDWVKAKRDNLTGLIPFIYVKLVD